MFDLLLFLPPAAFPGFPEKPVEIQVHPLAPIVFDLAPLDALQFHTQLPHKACRFQGVYRLSQEFMGMQAEKSIVHQAAAGLIGIALPPNAAIENPPNFIDIITL